MIEIVCKDGGFSYVTKGLSKLGHCELVATVGDIALAPACQEFISFVSNYVQEGHTLFPGETLLYGYGLTKLFAKNSMLEFWEEGSEEGDFIFGISKILAYRESQKKICRHATANFDPISPMQMVAVSEGVYEGDLVQGVRYSAPPHMSGWYLTTSKYNGDIGTLNVVHASHISLHRPDLVKFFALPCGYRFYSDTSEVWFDKKVIEDL